MSDSLTIDTELVEGLDPREALRRAQTAIRQGDIGLFVAAFYLNDIADRSGWVALGNRSMDDLIESRFRRRPKTIRNHMAVERGLRERPDIARAFAAGLINFTQARILVAITTPETAPRWIEWTLKHTLAQLEKHAAEREKGQLPSDEPRRGIHTPRVPVGARLVPTKYETWRRAHAKLEAMTGRSINEEDLIMFMSQRILEMEPDGSIPGWRRVNNRHYVVHAWSPDGRTLVTTGADGKHVVLDPPELADRLELKHPAASPPARVRGLDPANEGPEVPRAERDVPTPEKLRDEVLDRDGFQCRLCGKKKGVQVHHIHWRRYGGRTVRSNLVSTCEMCHSLIHAKLRIVLGDPDGKLTILDGQGQPFAPPPGEAFTWSVTAAVDAPAIRKVQAAIERVDLASLPAEVDAEWWERGRHLLTWSDRQGELVLAPGELAPKQDVRPTATPHTATAEETTTKEEAASAPETRTEEEAASAPETRTEKEAASAETTTEEEAASAETTTEEEAASAPAEEAPPSSTSASLPAAPSPRPSLVDLVGQPNVREQLRLAIAAAQQRGDQLKHLLFTGLPGLGKTSLARAVAIELGAPCLELAGPHVRGPEAIVRALASAPAGAVVFMDEVHAMSPRAAEVLYEALDRGTLTLPVREGLRTRTLTLRLRPFTLIGATTNEEQLPRALLSRLRVHHLAPYGVDELTQLLERAARGHGLTLSPAAARRLALASRETPRRALALLDLVRDRATVEGVSEVDDGLVGRVLERAGVDGDGLDEVDRALLDVLERSRRPVGIKTLASRLYVSVEALRTVHEPHLVRRGFVHVTREGRVLGDRRRRQVAEPSAEGGAPASAAG